MNENSRYKWKEMPSNYYASYYNEKDFREGKRFVIIDTKTGFQYNYPIIEKRKVERGWEYNQRVIDNDLWNQEFMYWACSTSPDFSLYLGEEWMDEKMMEILVTTPQNPDIFRSRKIPVYKLSQDLCNKAFATNPEVYTSLPEQYLTPEMTDVYVTLPNALFYKIPEKMRNAEIFVKLFTHLSKEEKVKLIKGNKYRIDYDVSYITKEIASEVLELDITVINRIPSEFITEEHSKKAVSVDGGYLQYVPEKFRTKDLCDKAFENNPSESIAFIPPQFHTLDMHKRVIDIKAVYVSRIPDEVLSDEIIRYAISKSAATLGCIPEERRTEEICNYAFNISHVSFSHIPTKYKTYDMCLKAALVKPKLIKKIPVEILNQQFVEALKLAKVIIPSDVVKYVKECLIVHERLEQEDLSIKANNGKTGEEMLAETQGNFTTIPLVNLTGFFTSNTLAILQNNGIITIGDLFVRSSKPNFIDSLGKINKNITNEILGAIKLLRCKYLDEDPLIEEDDSLDMETIRYKFGFSIRVWNALIRYGFNWKENLKFFETMRNQEERDYVLRRIRNMGPVGIEEVINKTQIVFDYHDRHKAKETESSDVEKHHEHSNTETASHTGETLESLNEELLRLREEMQRLTARTDEILSKIQQKMMEQSKGGVLK